jgi:two-component system, chemotaxis family, chemotaxis protein CheY
MRILIADDELVSRKLMERIMTGYGECVAVNGGQAALDAFQAAQEQEKPFDLITLDISMPDVNGLDVLYQIREMEKENNPLAGKRCVIIMVTSSADKDSIVTAVQAGCNDYIAKPIDRDTIYKKLIKVGLVSPPEGSAAKDRAPNVQKESNPLLAKENLLTAVRDVFEDFKKGKIELPAFPPALQSIQNVLKLPGAAPGEIASCILREPIVAALLLNAANSAPYGHPGGAKSVQQALTLVGVKDTGRIVSDMVTKSLYKPGNRQVDSVMGKIYRHCLATSCAARVIARRFNEDEETLLFLGLTHDIGKILLFHAVTLSLAGKNGAPGINMDSILTMIQSVHAGFGGALFQRWGFDKCLVDAVGAHEGPDLSAGVPRTVLILYLANMLTRRIGFSLLKEEPPEMVEAIRLLDLEETDIEVMMAEISERAKDLTALIV